jgi:glycosyltransferase involved in cell wall biosynthesis
MNQPLLSVVITAYNRAYILRDAIDSALSQGKGNREIQVIVVDDGSTDNTRSLVAEYGSRVQYVFQENQGMSTACNAGFHLAEGEYIAFLDSDDVWLPGKLAIELQLFQQFPEAGVIASDAESWLEDRLVNTSWMRMKGLSFVSAEPFFFSIADGAWLKQSLFATCCLTYRRDCLARLGSPLWNTALRSHSDCELEIRLLHYSRILVLPRVLAKVRRYNDGTRRGRAIPGSRPSSEQERLFAERRCQVIENALKLPAWTADTRSKLDETRMELLRKISSYEP